MSSAKLKEMIMTFQRNKKIHEKKNDFIITKIQKYVFFISISLIMFGNEILKSFLDAKSNMQLKIPL